MRRQSSLLKILALLALFALLVTACGQGQKVGSEKLLDFEAQENAKRLGQQENSPSPLPDEASKAALGATAPSPSPEPSPPPPPPEQFYNIELIGGSPYYRAEGEDASYFIVPVGFTLRVVNRDGTAERSHRSFTAEDGSFDSGDLAPGAVWTHKLTRQGKFSIRDRCCPFIFATLEVT